MIQVPSTCLMPAAKPCGTKNCPTAPRSRFQKRSPRKKPHGNNFHYLPKKVVKPTICQLTNEVNLEFPESVWVFTGLPGTEIDDWPRFSFVRTTIDPKVFSIHSGFFLRLKMCCHVIVFSSSGQCSSTCIVGLSQ